MSFSHLPALVSRTFVSFAHWLDRRTAARLPVLLTGLLFAAGRRTATSWFRAAGVTAEFRQAYRTVSAVGRRADSMAITAWYTVRPCVAGARRLVLALDDTPTPRYGPCVEGAGVHHNPTAGPADGGRTGHQGPDRLHLERDLPAEGHARRDREEAEQRDA